jgi:hypothetical protein
MCDLLEKKSSVLTKELFKQLDRSQYLTQLCLHGPLHVSSSSGRILSRGKSGQLSDKDQAKELQERKVQQQQTIAHQQQQQRKKKKIEATDSQRKSVYTKDSLVQKSSSNPNPNDGNQHSPTSEHTSSWFQRFNCFRKNAKISSFSFQTKLLELTSLSKPIGPHGRYCFCGCRGEYPS